MLTSFLSAPERVAIVITRLIPTAPRGEDGEPQLNDLHFADEPETCDLDKEVVRHSIGQAKVLIAEGRVPAPPPVDRAARLDTAIGLVMGMLPAIPAIHATLRHNGFSNSELGDLWDEIIARAADDFHADRAPLKATGAGLPDWGRQMLERNAE